jgi:RNA polymerase sigma factor (TIGR02999 family)
MSSHHDRETASLFEELYEQLRALAAAELRSERPAHTLQPTALVNEAFVRIRGSVAFDSRTKFLGYAATAMRRILVDHARARKALKRGGADRWRLTLTGDELRSADAGFDVLEIEDALCRLEAIEPRQARIVELRYFGGLPIATVAEVLEVSEETVRRDWNAAKRWFAAQLGEA